MRFSAFSLNSILFVCLTAILISCTIEKRRYRDGYSIQRLSTNKQGPHRLELDQFSIKDFPTKPTAYNDTTSCYQGTEIKISKDVFNTLSNVDTLTDPIDTLKNEYTVPFYPKKTFKKSSKNAAAGLGMAALGLGTTQIMTYSLKDFFLALPFFKILFVALGILLLGLWIYALITRISLRKKEKAQLKENREVKHFTHQSSSLHFSEINTISAGLLYSLVLIFAVSALTLIFTYLSTEGLEFPQKMIALLGYSAIVIQLVLIAFCAYKIWKLTRAGRNSRIDS